MRYGISLIYLLIYHSRSILDNRIKRLEDYIFDNNDIKDWTLLWSIEIEKVYNFIYIYKYSNTFFSLYTILWPWHANKEYKYVIYFLNTD